MEGSLSSPLLQQVERGRESRRKLYGKLCRLGVMIRLLTMLNAMAIVGAAGYSLCAFARLSLASDLHPGRVSMPWRRCCSYLTLDTLRFSQTFGVRRT